MELPIAPTDSGLGVRFITRLGDEEGLFVCVNPYAAEAWFDAWCRSNPLASAADKRAAIWAANLLNTVDLDAVPADVRPEFFKLDDAGNLLERSDPRREPPGAPAVVKRADDHFAPACAPPGAGQSSWSGWPRTAIALAAATVVLMLTTAGLLVAVLLEDRPTVVAGDAQTSRGEVVTAAHRVETESRSNPSGLSKPTARSAGALGVRAAIDRHWMKRERQQLSSAYADLSPRLRADPAVGSESAWVARQEENPLQDVNVWVQPTNVTKRTAQADVEMLRTQTPLGCTEWSGFYSLVRSGGRWLIDSQSLTRRPC